MRSRNVWATNSAQNTPKRSADVHYRPEPGLGRAVCWGMIVMPGHIATPRLDLRAPTPQDGPAIWAYASDPVATRYMVWPTHETPDDLDDFLDDVADGWAAGDDFTYGIVLRASATFVGMASCRFSDEGAEIGFIVAPAYWGQGIAREAAGHVLDAAREISSIYRFWATCDADNPASTAVLKALGMSFEGCLRRRSMRPNRADVIGPQDDLIYAWVRP